MMELCRLIAALLLGVCVTAPRLLPSPLPPGPAAGTSQWPGANFILFPSGDKVFLKFGDRRRIASELKIGDIVERHLDRECPPPSSPILGPTPELLVC